MWIYYKANLYSPRELLDFPFSGNEIVSEPHLVYHFKRRKRRKGEMQCSNKNVKYLKQLPSAYLSTHRENTFSDNNETIWQQ